MKRKEWVILAAVIAAVAALEVFGAGGDMPQNAPPEAGVQGVSRTAQPARPPEPAADPMEAYRTTRLHVTGMT